MFLDSLFLLTARAARIFFFWIDLVGQTIQQVAIFLRVAREPPPKRTRILQLWPRAKREFENQRA